MATVLASDGLTNKHFGHYALLKIFPLRSPSTSAESDTQVNLYWFDGSSCSQCCHNSGNQCIWLLSSGQTDRHCLANISNFACQACLCIWLPRQALLDKHILLVNFQKHFLLVTSKIICQGRVCVVVKQTSIVLDKQNFKCLSNRVCPFGQEIKMKPSCMLLLWHLFLTLFRLGGGGPVGAMCPLQVFAL